MPFSILLLTAASSERHISGYGGDRVSMQADLLPGEIVLFFDRVDSDLVRRGLGMSNKCCDGIIFYANSQEMIICLVEMKSDDLGDAEEQIKATYEHLKEMLHAECTFCKDRLKQIIWRAYIYRSGGTPRQEVEVRVKRLENIGFKSGNVAILGNSDITSFLRNGITSWGHKKSKSRSH